ncbi:MULTISPECIES: MBL fold metallo-hydrolase [Flavobacterium]|uniref:MBL fold metallo-hydrolase n=1 Tax=Flavobacterium algoritolerans TaxID=3041254 RepID=A0ABT6VCQ9_9FLAO|nr:MULTISPECIES: MBL fold metallo-hydrolase [Flavobacterium]MDI5888446.1 MBL fold metallo-hydrolase [Flavobacterium yafengii]MDI5895997.1 MBL fold metallo-hydrolase [Flavobacterium algoritolerans]
MEQQIYLKQNIQIEPLVNKWFAWVHLISPATAALNLFERYVRIMDSYVEYPELHASAVKNPEMRGGPFIDLDGKRVEDVKKLINEIKQSNKDLFDFKVAINDLHKLLEEKAKGFSLEPLYKEVPDLLKGYVELYYDINNNASFRFFEALLYKSPYYSVASQSIALSEIIKDKDRPFIMSTPRLPDEKVLHLPMSFDSKGLDELFKMKNTPQTYAFIKEKLGVFLPEEELFKSFFTTEAPPKYQKYEGDGIRTRYFGHACILVETKNVSILLDPVLSYTYESDLSRYTYLDLPDQIDYVLITHSHQDHILLETLLQIRHKVKNIIVGRNMDGILEDPSLKLALENLGFKNVFELRDLEEISFTEGSITGVPFLGEHHDLCINSKLGYVIRVDGYSVLAVADACNIEPRLYEHINRVVGNVDVLFLGMECDGSPASWAYGPLFPKVLEREADRSRRGRGSNFKEGLKLVEAFNCKEVYVYAMGQEPWLKHILDLEYTNESNPIIQSNYLIETCESRGIVAERLFGERELLSVEKHEFSEEIIL